MNHTAITSRVLQNGKTVNQNYFDSSSIKKVWGQLNLSLLYCFLRSSKKKFIFTVNTKCSIIWFCSYPLKGNQGPWTSESKYSCSLCVFCHFYCRKWWKWYMAKRSIFWAYSTRLVNTKALVQAPYKTGESTFSNVCISLQSLIILQQLSIAPLHRSSSQLLGTIPGFFRMYIL